MANEQYEIYQQGTAAALASRQLALLGSKADKTGTYSTLTAGGTTPNSVTDAMLAPDGIKAQVASMWGNRLTGELTGEVLTASDAYAAPPLAVGVDGNSTQDGTPTPSAPVAIESVDALTLHVAGKNLFRAPTWAEVSALELISGYLYWPMHLKPNTTYYVSNTEHDGYTSIGTRLYLLLSPTMQNSPWIAIAHNTVGATSGTITTDSSGIIYLAVNGYDATQANYEDAINGVYTMLTEGSTAVPYEPYVGTTTTIPLQGHELRSLPDGTADTLTIASDGAVTLTQRVGVVTLDGTNQSWVPWISSSGTYARFGIDNSTVAACEPLSNKLDTLNGINDLLTTAYGIYGGTDRRIYFSIDDTVTTEAGAKTWLESNPVTVHYKLATPQTISIGTVSLPTLPTGNATIWATGGSAQPTYSMQYVRDCNLVVKQLTAETAIAYASIAAQDGPTATASHSIGTYLTMGGTLYKVTQAIAVGETIAAGTNVIATTVMAELLARTA